MTSREKKRKAAMIAVAYYLEQEKQAAGKKDHHESRWAEMAKERMMENRQRVQRSPKYSN